MKKLITRPLILLLLLVALLPCSTVLAMTTVTTELTEADRQAVLARQKYLFWQQINQARTNPRATLARLGIPLEQARTALGAGAWLLDQGLPPLAWNNQLSQAASLHGRDMLTRLYYSHVSPDGLRPAQRIAATGYRAVAEDETLAALAFANPVELERAVAAMLDNMLRDELTATAGVPRNIFSPVLSDVGISFFAESLPLLAGKPYVYLLVLDFALPLEPVPYLVGRVDAGQRLAMNLLSNGFWDALPLLPGGSFQLKLPVGGANLVVYDTLNQVIATRTAIDDGSVTNRYFDLRSGGGGL